jgi:hypothetical protein
MLLPPPLPWGEPQVSLKEVAKRVGAVRHDGQATRTWKSSIKDDQVTKLPS